MEGLPYTALRRTYERARRLPPSDQLDECVDQLLHPELLEAELLAAGREIEAAAGQLEPGIAFASDVVCDPRESWFYPSRDLSVLGAPSAFTCLACAVEPLGDPRERGAAEGPLDYVGFTCDESFTPVLGAVQSGTDANEYPLLLRALANLMELSSPPQIDQANRSLFRGALRMPPRFDLNLVCFDAWEAGQPLEHTPISELTRDLAERACDVLRAESSLGGLLRGIVCLRMNPDRFDGRLRFVWRV